MSELCPCGSKYQYTDCCSPIINLQSLDLTPEQLMRSRYTAFYYGNEPYLRNSMQAKALKDWENQQHNQNITWQKLEIISAPPAKNDEGYVEFIAYYQLDGKNYQLHEKSRFIKKTGRWYYVDGEHVPTGRNSPCPCGSGKKFKKCCFGN